MPAPATARITILATAIACGLVPGYPGRAAEPKVPPSPPKVREIPLDLPADFPPVLCSGAVHLFSGTGRNQTLAPGDPAPVCNLLPLHPVVAPACSPEGTLVLDKAGTLWKVTTEGTSALEEGIEGAVALAIRTAGPPAVLAGNSLVLPGGGRRDLPFPASRLEVLNDGGFWLADRTSGARLDADGKALWTWRGDLASTGAALAGSSLAVGTEEGFLAVLDAGTGRERFRYPTGGRIAAAPHLSEGLAVFGSNDHLVRAVRLKDGQLAWQVRLDGRVAFGPLLTRVGLLFAVAAGNSLVALAPKDGRRTWSWTLPSGSILQSPACLPDLAAVLAWGETDNPTLYLVDVPEPPPAPPVPKKKSARRAKPKKP